MIKRWIFGLLFLGSSLGGLCQQSLRERIAHGKSVYQKICLSCHQADGTGVPHMNPPLVHSGFVTGSADSLILWVLKGSTASVPIGGKYYSNNMPAQATLTNVDIAAVLTFIRTNFQNKASQVTPAEVNKVRNSLAGKK